MSRSPRKLLRRADDALAEFFATCERYPEAREQVIGNIGDAAWRELTAARNTVRRLAERLDGGSGDADPADHP